MDRERGRGREKMRERERERWRKGSVVMGVAVEWSKHCKSIP